MSNKYKNFKEFWPFYLSEHSNKWNRALHFVGSSLSLFWLVTFIFTLNPFFILYALLNGYLFAWIGHFIIEKNRPATFTYPFKSFLGDWVMFYYTLTGKINKEIEKIKLK